MATSAATRLWFATGSLNVLAVPAFVATKNELKLSLCALCDLPVKKDSQGDREKSKRKKLNSVMAA